MTSAAKELKVATPRIAAGVLFLDDQQRILMVRPTYKSYWDIPGGYVEPGESPHAACVREIHEELGLHVEIGRLLSVDWAPHPDEGDKMLFIFEGGQLDTRQLSNITFRDGEIGEYEFVDHVDLDRFTIPRLTRRLASTLEAQNTGRSAYLEGGVYSDAGLGLTGPHRHSH